MGRCLPSNRNATLLDCSWCNRWRSINHCWQTNGDHKAFTAIAGNDAWLKISNELAQEDDLDPADFDAIATTICTNLTSPRVREVADVHRGDQNRFSVYRSKADG